MSGRGRLKLSESTVDAGRMTPLAGPGVDLNGGIGRRECEGARKRDQQSVPEMFKVPSKLLLNE